MPTFARVLHADVVRRLAGLTIYERGAAYFRQGRILSMVQEKGALAGTVRGSTPYAVRIWINGNTIAYSCECPFAEEAFCKHAVALSIAWLAACGETLPAAKELRARLQSMQPELLVELLLGEAETDASFREALQRIVRERQ